MLVDDFLSDAQKLIHWSAPLIRERMDETGFIQATTFFAFGVERLLKHLLAVINPALVLKNSDFESIAHCLYRQKIISPEKKTEVAKKATDDVISLRTAIYRAAISPGVKDNMHFLHAVASYRDLIAHRPISELEQAKVAHLLQRDAHKAIAEICQSHSLQASDFFGSDEQRLGKLSQAIYQREHFENRMSSLLESHAAIWVKRSSDQAYVDKAKRITTSLLYSKQTTNYVSFPCPACEQEAVAFLEPDWEYDPVDETGYITGVYVDHVSCKYCGLELREYDELDYIDANGILERAEAQA